MDIPALMISYVLSLFYRNFLAVLAPYLVEDLGVTASDLSSAVGAWYLLFAICQIPTGLALDRIGPRRVVSVALAVGAGGGALVFAGATSAWMLYAAMALIGAGCAPILMSGMFLFARRFEPRRFATLTGAMMGVGGFGNILGAAPLTWAVEAFGWREVMTVLAGVAVLLAAVLAALVRDPPALEAPSGGGLKALGFGGFWELLKMPVLLAILPLAFMNYSVSGGMRGLWGGAYLAEIQGLSAVAIGEAMLWMAIAMTVGNFIYGPMDRVLGTRKWMVVGLNGTGCLCVAGLAFAGPGPDGAVALIVALGLFGATYAVLMAHFRSFVPARLIGRGVTLINVFGMIGTSFGQFVTAGLASPALEAGDPATAYNRVFLWYICTLGAALVLYILFAKDAKPDQSA